ncbi:MAG: hypothetical protein KDC83_07135 [Flavobacteriales bacterium]|nr:hypothetical protein [Flavobacteriales bacterium]
MSKRLTGKSLGRRILCAFLLVIGLLATSNAYSQDDILDAIEAELRAEEEKKKNAEKAAKNEEKFKANYAAAKAKGDALVRARKYADAIESYEEAKKWGPLETYPEEQIAKVKELKEKAEAEEKAAAIEAEYKEIIAKADVYFTGKRYDEAIAGYENAAKVKEGDAYATDQIALAKKEKIAYEEELKKKAEAAELQAKYDDAMKSGDELMKSKNYSGAIDFYKKAQEAKPGEVEPKARIDNATRLGEQALKAEEQAKTEAAFADEMNKASELIKSKDYDNAILAYEAAQKIKPNDPTPKTKIAEANKLKANQLAADTKAKYDEIIKEADALLKSSSFDEAKAKYTEASALISQEIYPKTKIKECDELKVAAQKAEIRAQYDALVREADELLKNKDYDAAIAKYKEAEAVLPLEQHPKTMITLAEKSKKDDAQAAVQKEYDDLILAGEASLKNKSYPEAIAKFEEAGKIIPQNPRHKELIEQTNKLITQEDAARVKAQFDAVLTEAEELIKKEDFDGGIAKLDEAHSILPSETKTVELKAEATRLKAEKEKSLLNEQFAEKLKQGEALLKEEKFDEAIAVFNEAQQLLPTDVRAKNLIDQAQKQKATKFQAEAEAQFQELIKSGDALLASEDFEGAKQAYLDAKSAYPAGSATADAKIAKAESLAKQKAEKEQAEMALKEQEQVFDEAMAKAATLKAANDFEGAIKEVESALLLFPDEKTAQKELSELQKLDANAKKEKVEKEKLEAEAKEKADKEAQVAVLLTEADALAASKDFAGAKAKVSASLAIMATHANATAKLKEIETLETAEIARVEEEKKNAALNAQKAAELEAAAAAAAALKAKEDQVNNLLAEATELKDTKDFEGARKKANEALLVVPKHAGAKSKLEEIDAAEKISLANAEEQAKQKALEEKEMAEKQAKIDKLMVSADKQKTSGKLTEAKATYTEILALDENYAAAAEGLAAIVAIEAEQLAAEEARKKAEQEKLAAADAEQKEKLNKVAALLEESDNLLKSSQFVNAREKANESLKLIPNNEAGLKKLDEIAAAEKLMEERLLKIENLQKEAFVLKTAANYDAAKGKFREILALDPNHEQAKSEIIELDKLSAKALADAKAKQEAEELAKSKAEIDAKVAEFISLGDKALKKKSLAEAQANYKSAIDLDQSNEIAQSKYKLASEQLAAAEKERLAAEEAEKQKLAEQAAAQSEADKAAKIEALMAEADLAADAKNYNRAIAKLGEVLAISPGYEIATSKVATLKEKSELQKKQQEADAKANKERAEAEASAKLEKEKNIQIRSYMSIGDQLVASKKYDEAMETYGKIIDVDPENSEASARIVKAKQLKIQEAERLEALNALEKEELINTHLREAHTSVIRKNYLAAEEKYKEVLALESTNAAAIQGLKEIEGKLEAARAEQAKMEEAARLKAEQEAKIRQFLDAGDDLYAGGQYDKAISKYQEGLLIDPVSYSLKQAIHEAIEMKNRMNQMILARTHNKPRPKPQGFKTELLDENQKERADVRKFQNELGKKYPPGVTEESRKENRKTITTRFVVKDKVGTEFNRVHHDWGGLYYFKNGVPVSTFIWDLETRDPTKTPN